MSFERGSVSFRIFKSGLSSQTSTFEIPDDVAEKFAANAIPGADAISADGNVGWTTARHLLDRNITADSIVVAGRIRATLVKAERKIPGALFKTECKQEELATMAARGVQFLNRSERSEIAKSVRERMLPCMPLSLSGIDVVTTKDGAYATAISDSNVDSLTYSWRQTLGQNLIPYTPTIAAKFNGVDVLNLNPTSFSPIVSDDNAEQNIGTEFLTWLWYFSENKGGIHNGYAFALDGPFSFVHEGNGAHEIVVRKGNPGLSSEVKSTLLAGKKLIKAKLIVVRDGEQWSCVLNGNEWTFGSLKLPKGEKLDLISTFETRMLSIGSFFNAFEGLFKEFLSIRKDETLWLKEVGNIHQWVNDRVGQV